MTEHPSTILRRASTVWRHNDRGTRDNVLHITTGYGPTDWLLGASWHGCDVGCVGVPLARCRLIPDGERCYCWKR